MSIDKEKKTFVIKHTFTDVKNIKNYERHYGKPEKHFNIPWNIYIVPRESSSLVTVALVCLKFRGKEEWSIETTIIGELVTSTGEKLHNKNHIFSHNSGHPYLCFEKPIKEYIVDGNLTVECHVDINKITGTNTPIYKNFDDESAKEFSDVVLKVMGQNFYVSKLYLASQSSYFKSLLFGNFCESKQSEVELKDISPYSFHKFLEMLYGEPVINDYYAPKILQLADMFDATTVIRQCEQFYLHRSKKGLKRKFNYAVKYNMDQLKRKCISELKTIEDIEKIIPEDDSHIDHLNLIINNDD